MNITPLRTTRLELIPLTEELCLADLSSPAILGKMLYASIPDEWPPALLTHETMQEFLELLNAPGGSSLLAYYWITAGKSRGERILIGSGGSIIKNDGIPEIGYSVLEQYQSKGYATEAVYAITTWLKQKLKPDFIRAYTFPSLTGSIRVLEKTGFILSGTNHDEGTIEYRLYE